MIAGGGDGADVDVGGDASLDSDAGVADEVENTGVLRCGAAQQGRAVADALGAERLNRHRDLRRRPPLASVDGDANASGAGGDDPGAGSNASASGAGGGRRRAAEGASWTLTGSVFSSTDGGA